MIRSAGKTLVTQKEVETGILGDMDGEKLVVGFVPFVMRIADLPEAESREIEDDLPYDHFFADHGSLTDNSDHKNAYDTRLMMRR